MIPIRIPAIPSTCYSNHPSFLTVDDWVFPIKTCYIVIYSNTKKGGLSFNHQLLALIFGVLVSMPGGQANDDSTVTAIKSKTLPGNACRAAEAVEDIELLKEDRGLRSSGNTSAGWRLKGFVAQKSLWVFEGISTVEDVEGEFISQHFWFFLQRSSKILMKRHDWQSTLKQSATCIANSYLKRNATCPVFSRFIHIQHIHLGNYIWVTDSDVNMS